MIPFEIIILLLLYIFCCAFSTAILMEADCSTIERVILFLLMLVIAPIFAVATLGVYIATILHSYVHK